MRLLFLALALTPVLYAQTYQEKVLAAVLVAEATGEGAQGMRAVAEVIRQRAHEKDKTPFQVVIDGTTKRRAFSCLNRTTPNSLYRRWNKDENYGEALKIAAVLIQQPERLGGLTRQATHYTRRWEKPYWAKGKRPVMVIGRHAFYRLEAY